MSAHICPHWDCHQGKVMNSGTLTEDTCPICQGSGFITQEQYSDACEEFTGRPSDSEEVIMMDQDVYTKSGKVLSRQYDRVDDFHDGLAEVELNGKYGFINTEGDEVTPLKYDSVWEFQEGFYPVKLNGKWGLINTQGEEVTPLKYDWIEDFRDGFAKVVLVVNGKAKCGFVNTEGKEVMSLYDGVWAFREGLAGVRLDGKWGFINTKGEAVIPPQYDDVEDFYEGFARVMLNDKCGLINSVGEEVIPPKYDDVRVFHDDGFAEVELDGKEGFVVIQVK